MLVSARGTSGCSGTFWAPQHQEIFLSGVGKPQAEKSSWSLSRPQGFQNIWYPQAGSTHLQHCAFPVPSTPSQKSHNCFYSDFAQCSSLKRHGCENTNFWTIFEIMILFMVSKLSFNHTRKTAKEINLTEQHKLLHSAFMGAQREGAHPAQDTEPASDTKDKLR